MPTKEEQYYTVLQFLDEQTKRGNLNPEALTSFKETIRDNKYISTYIRSLKSKMEKINSIEDVRRDIARSTRLFDSSVSYEVKSLLRSIPNYTPNIDPVNIINDIIYNALDREGKICDFRDSIFPDTKIGRCEYGNHGEDIPVEDILTEKQNEKFKEIGKKQDWGTAYEYFEDELNPSNQELTMILYQDEDTHKFVDDESCYACKTCCDGMSESGDCEVVCDMEASN